MFYAANETALNLDFLSVTNQFDIDHYDLNANFKEVDAKLRKINGLKAEGKTEEASTLELEAKQMVGFFNKNGRVKMITLRKCPSMGYLFGIDSMAMYCPAIKKVNLEEWIDKDFDTVNGELFIKVYVPNTSHSVGANSRRAKKRMKKLATFNRMIPGQFAFHYDTQQLNRAIHHLTPDTPVSISLKVHGTSGIIGNIKVKKPKWQDGLFGKIYNKIFVYLPTRFQKTIETYDTIYSSRTVIINSDINPGKPTEGYAGGMVQKNIEKYAKMLKPYLAEGMTVYFEIVGYYDGTSTPIQKIGDGYDYGCDEGTNKMMPYRITSKIENSEVFEWEVQEVHDWTCKMIKDHPEFECCMMPINILYKGTLGNLYPNLDPSNHWHENVLEIMKNDKNHFGMEINEPLCKNKVPREGIVLRIDGDPMKEAFKLKCLKFLKKEGESIDNGTYQDAETEEKYNGDEN